jgi:hypothetical protein
MHRYRCRGSVLWHRSHRPKAPRGPFLQAAASPGRYAIWGLLATGVSFT